MTRAIDGVAVDSTGKVWVFQARTVGQRLHERPVERVHLTQVDGQSARLRRAPASPSTAPATSTCACSSWARANTRSSRSTPNANVLNENVGGKEASAVAAEQGSDNALVDNLTSVGVFNAAGEEVERLGEEGAKHLEEGAGIGVNESATRVYVADSLSGEVFLFGPKKPSAPKVESESIGEVSSEEATLAAEINPQSEVGEAPTKYRFEYARCTIRERLRGKRL